MTAAPSEAPPATASSNRFSLDEADTDMSPPEEICVSLADPGVHVLVDHVDDDRDADGRAALGERKRAGDVHELRRVGRADGDRLSRGAQRAALVDLRGVCDPGLRRDREDVDDHGAGDRRVATACAAADRD